MITPSSFCSNSTSDWSNECDASYLGLKESSSRPTSLDNIHHCQTSTTPRALSCDILVSQHLSGAILKESVFNMEDRTLSRQSTQAPSRDPSPKTQPRDAAEDCVADRVADSMPKETLSNQVQQTRSIDQGKKPSNSPTFIDCSSSMRAQLEKARMDNLVKELANSYNVEACVLTLHCSKGFEFYASHGLHDRVVPPRMSTKFQFFCHSISRSLPTVIYDAEEHELVKDDILVVGEQHLRFYVCAPLIYQRGKYLGTLCIFDKTPRFPFSMQDCQPLVEKAAEVVNVIKNHEIW